MNSDNGVLCNAPPILLLTHGQEIFMYKLRNLMEWFHYYMY